MEDMSAKINEILNDSESMSQIMQLAQSLGFSGNSGQNANQQPSGSAPNNQSGQNFQQNPQNKQNAQQNYQNSPPNNQNGQNFKQDSQNKAFNNQNMQNAQQNYQKSSPNNQNDNKSQNAIPNNKNAENDISSMLTGIMNSLDNGNNKQPQQGDKPPIDAGTIMKIQKTMSAFNASNKNVELLKSLKPHFGEPRQKKVDDAIKIMQLINMLPLLKESGLFGTSGNDK